MQTRAHIQPRCKKHKMAKAIKPQLWAKTEEHWRVQAKPYITNENRSFWMTIHISKMVKRTNKHSLIHLSIQWVSQAVYSMEGQTAEMQTEQRRQGWRFPFKVAVRHLRQETFNIDRVKCANHPCLQLKLFGRSHFKLAELKHNLFRLHTKICSKIMKLLKELKKKKLQGSIAVTNMGTELYIVFAHTIH